MDNIVTFKVTAGTPYSPTAQRSAVKNSRTDTNIREFERDFEFGILEANHRLDH